MKRTLKVIPFVDKEKVRNLAIVRITKDPKKNNPGHDTDFKLMVSGKDGKWMAPGEMTENDMMFLAINILFTTTLPEQYIKQLDDIPEDKATESRWEAVADDL